MNKRLLVIIMLCFLCCGCKKSDAVTFKREYEKYNNKYIELDIDDDNIVKYSDVDSINKIIKSGSGVIFIGNPTDDVSRKVIGLLLKVSESTDLENIYYIDSLDGIDGVGEDVKVPVVLFVLNGKIVKKQIGTIGDKVDLSKEEEMDLYNIYLDGIHEVLGDVCEEEC